MRIGVAFSSDDQQGLEAIMHGGGGRTGVEKCQHGAGD